MGTVSRLASKATAVVQELRRVLEELPHPENYAQLLRCTSKFLEVASQDLEPPSRRGRKRALGGQLKRVSALRQAVSRRDGKLADL